MSATIYPAGHPDAPLENADKVQRVTPLEPPPAEPVAEPVVEPVAEVPPPAPVELPELRYTYQPTDDHGRPLGGKQVIKYRTPDELADKLAAQNTELVRKLREVTRKQRLGISDDEPLPEDLDKLPDLKIEPKPLTPEELFDLSQDLNNPAKFADARDRLLASSGLPDAVNQQQAIINKLLAKANCEVFLQSHPEFMTISGTQDNANQNMHEICDWMVKKGLHPTPKNFEYAFSKTREAGLLLESPSVQEAPEPPAPPQPPVVAAPVQVAPENVVPNSQVPAAPVARISDVDAAATKSQVHVPSGLNSRVASNAGEVIPETPAFTLAQIDRMSSDEYKYHIAHTPGFSQLVGKLMDEQAAKMKQPRR